MAKVFLIAGHGGGDPGAVANNVREADLARELRDLMAAALRKKGVLVMTDPDTLNLRGTIAWVRQHAEFEDVLVDTHFNAATPAATGAEVFIRRTYSDTEMQLAQRLASSLSDVQGIRNRGVKLESQTRHGRLGILHSGVHCSALLEVGFLTNAGDLKAYRANKMALSEALTDDIYTILTEDA